MNATVNNAASPPRAAHAPAGQAAGKTGAAQGAAGAGGSATPADAFAALLESLGEALEGPGLAPEAGVAADTATAAAEEPVDEKAGAPAPFVNDLAAQPALPWPLQAVVAGGAPDKAPGNTRGGKDLLESSGGVAAGGTGQRAGDKGDKAGKAGPEGLDLSGLAAPEAAPAAKPASLPAAFADLMAKPMHEAQPAARSALPEGIAALAASAPAPAGIGAAASRPAHEAALEARPGEAQFAAELADEVQLMVQGGLQEAQLSLNPAELGPIRIQLAIRDQTAELSFAAAHEATREGIEQALPELREMFAAEGLNLAQAGVGTGLDGRAAQDFAQAREAAERHRAGSGAGGAPMGGGEAPAAPVLRRATRGMLDLYA